jgi:hypothetical protein
MAADLSLIFSTVLGNMGPVSYVIYAVGAFEGYRLSMRNSA